MDDVFGGHRASKG